jgi:branched-chain amino acid transport system substrate-binding protein
MLKTLAWLAGFTAAMACFPAAAEIPGNRITIAVLTDLSGSNEVLSGHGSIEGARLAIADAAAFLPGVTIDLISADMPPKADAASAIARSWLAAGNVNVIADVPFSSAGLAVNDVVRNAPRTLYIASGTGTSDLTGPACSPNTLHWTYDTYAISQVVARALVGQGLKSWFFITADYAFGTALERDATKTITSLGGTVVGGTKNPPFNSDYSSYLLTAQSSKAQVIGLANASSDLINLVKQAHEFGITKGGQRLAALLTFITDVRALGLDTAQGLYLASPFYWDLNDRTRAFSARFSERMHGAKPTMIQAGMYSSILHYLKAVKQANSVDAQAVMAAMRAMPTQDDAFGTGSVRPDGRVIHDFHLFQVKTPAESHGDWDVYKLVATVPAAEAFRPLSEGGCPLVK